MDENESGIKRVAHFFLSRHEKNVPAPFREGISADESLTLELLREKRRVGLLWLTRHKSHVALSSALAHRVAQLFSGERMIRLCIFKDSLQAGWMELRSYFPTLPHALPSDSELDSAHYGLTSWVKLGCILNGVDREGTVASPAGVIYLISISGYEDALEDSFFRTLDHVILISAPDREGLYQLYQTVKTLTVKAPGLSVGSFFDGRGFSHTEAWDFFSEFRAVVKRLLNRSLDLLGLCDSEGMLTKTSLVETSDQDVCLF